MTGPGEITLRFEVVAEVDLSRLDRLERAMREAQTECEQLVVNTGAKLKKEWIGDASQLLKHRNGYVQAIQDGTKYPFEDDPLHFVIINDHKAARYLEEGVRPFDMRRLLEHSAKVRTAKDGSRYIIVPFTHTPKQLMSAGIDYNEVKNLNPSFFRRGSFPRGSQADKANTDPRRKAHSYQWGESLTDMGDVGKRTKAFGQLHERKTITYDWKWSPFEKMYRFQQKGGGNELMTFRTLSEKSDPGNWQHPGIRAMKFAENAINIVRPEFLYEVDRIVERIKEKFQGK